MNRQQIIGLLLIFGIILGYSIYITPSAEELAEQERQDSLRSIELKEKREAKEKARRDSLALLKNDTASSLAADTIAEHNKDSLIVEKNKEKYGVFASALEGEEEIISLENDLISVKFSNKGAFPIHARLKKFKRYDGDSLILFGKGDHRLNLNFFSDGRHIATEKLFFEIQNHTSKQIKVGSSEKSIKFRLKASENEYIEYVYTLSPDSYKMRWDINVIGMTEHIPHNTFELDLEWDAKLRRQEKGADWENQNTTAYFKYKDDEVDRLSPTSDEDEDVLESKVRWLAFKNHFFSNALIAHESFSDGEVEFVADPDEEKYLKYFHSGLSLPYKPKENNQYAMTWYLGPNDYDILSEIQTKEGDELEMKRMIPLGWALFRWISQFIIIPLFNLLGSFISSYGIIILVMTIIIKAALFPLTYRSYRSSAKMRVLKPQIDEISAKYPKEKAMEKQQATMSLYRKAGVNPLGGCLPMLLQFPILIAMYLFFPASIELRQESFLWAEDLSTYDSIWNFPGNFSIPFYGDHVSLFTLLMAAAMLISTIMNSSQMQSNQQMPGMKFMLYLMPVMMLFWFNNYSSGLSYYYFLSNVITIIQIIVARKLIDEDKILAKLQANQKKNKNKKNKSKFQQRIEKMAKERGVEPPKSRKK